MPTRHGSNRRGSAAKRELLNALVRSPLDSIDTGHSNRDNPAVYQLQLSEHTLKREGQRLSAAELLVRSQ